MSVTNLHSASSHPALNRDLREGEVLHGVRGSPPPGASTTASTGYQEGWGGLGQHQGGVVTDAAVAGMGDGAEASQAGLYHFVVHPFRRGDWKKDHERDIYKLVSNFKTLIGIQICYFY